MHFEFIGNKYEHQGKHYKKGDVIETEVDLAARYRGSFRRVASIPGGFAPLASLIKDPNAPAAKPAAPAPAIPAPPVVVKTAAAPIKIAAPDPALAARGTDVTTKFPATAAHPEGFKVFQRGELFHVFMGDAVTPINAAGLKADAVDAAVEKYLG